MKVPPKYMELFVELLTPPACREHVLGDLRERYENPARYLLDALSTLPMVIGSRIRRTTDSRMLALEIGALATAFGAAAMGGLPYVASLLWIVPILILAGLAGLRVAAAYTPKPLIQVFGAFLAMQLVYMAYPVLPRGLFLTGVTWSVLLLATLRTLWPEQPVPAPASLDELRARALGYERTIRRRNFREYAAALFVALFFVWKAAFSSSSFPRYGSLAIIAAVVYCAMQIRRWAQPHKISVDAPLPALLEFYRTELQRQRDVHRASWPRKQAPVAVAITVFLFAAGFGNPQLAARLPLIAGPMLLLILIAWKWNQNLARRLDREMETVDAARNQL